MVSPQKGINIPTQTSSNTISFSSDYREEAWLPDGYFFIFLSIFCVALDANYSSLAKHCNSFEGHCTFNVVTIAYDKVSIFSHEYFISIFI
jgi:hypothetical protein